MLRPRIWTAMSATAIGAAALVALSVAPASAGAVGPCHNPTAGSAGTLCYFYHSNEQGSQEGVTNKVPDLSSPPIYFEGNAGAGEGLRVWNDAGSAGNNRTDCKAHVFFSANYGGPEVTLQPEGQNGSVNPTLGADNNNNRSQNFC